MRAIPKGRDELAARVQQALALPTKKEAEHIVNLVIGSLGATLLNNRGTNGFTLKLGSFGKFSVRHKSGILRRDDPDKRQAEGKVRQFGRASAAGKGELKRPQARSPLAILAL
jgi:nucleoid DNA-binding protein